MSILLWILLALNYASFGWSNLIVFKTPSEIDEPKLKRLKLGTFFTWLVNIYLLFQLDPLLIYYFFGFFGLTFSLGLFWITIHHVSQTKFHLIYGRVTPTHVVAIGPYKYIRHPFYTSYLICYLTTFLMTMHLLTLVMFMVMFILYYMAALNEEKMFLQSSLREEYLQYQKHTGMFLPKIELPLGPLFTRL